MPKIFLLLIGMAMTAGGIGTGVNRFTNAARLRTEAEELSIVLTQSGQTNPCTASSEANSACRFIDDLNVAADLSTAVGVTAFFAAGGGIFVTAQQLFERRAPSQPASPQVALTTVRGGGLLTVTGTF